MSLNANAISSMELKEGFRNGIPIGLGYFAVSFSLGIAAQTAGLTPFQSFLSSILCSASAGQYAGYTSIAAAAPYLEVAVITFIANARYLLMSCAYSQRMNPDLSLLHRLCMSFAITDELFAINISRPGYLSPWYCYGAMLAATPMWAIGTYCGAVAGNVLPLRVVSALSVALYGMFLAVIIPPARKDRLIGILVLISFAFSYLGEKLPLVSSLSSGTRTIILTVVIAGAAAILFPHRENENAKEEER